MQQNEQKLVKSSQKVHFSTKIFGQFKKKQYLCTRFPKKALLRRTTKATFLPL